MNGILEPEEPRICRCCDKEPCTGEPWVCEQDFEDSRGDYEYEKERDDRDERNQNEKGKES